MQSSVIIKMKCVEMNQKHFVVKINIIIFRLQLVNCHLSIYFISQCPVECCCSYRKRHTRILFGWTSLCLLMNEYNLQNMEPAPGVFSITTMTTSLNNLNSRGCLRWHPMARWAEPIYKQYRNCIQHWHTFHS